MRIRWSLLSELPVPADASLPEWLGPAERRHAGGLHVPKRRADWLRGRFAAKRLAARILREVAGEEIGLDGFDIVAGPSGAPVVRLAEGGTLPAGVSISHSEGSAFCAAWGDAPGDLSAGVDLERIAPRSEGLVRDFFRPAEASAWETLAPGSARDAFATAVWSAKEAVLKALRLGLTVDTRSVEILLSRSPAPGVPGLPRPEGGGWMGFAACCAPGLPGGDQPLAGFWREQDGFVLSVAVAGGRSEHSHAA